MATPSIEAVEIPDVGNNLSDKLRYMTRAGRTIEHVVPKYRKGLPPQPEQVRVLEGFLAWLDQCLEMTPAIKQGTSIERRIGLVIDPNLHFPDHFANKARLLKARWESENWGQDLIVDEPEESEGEDVSSPIMSPTAPASKSFNFKSARNDSPITIHSPPRNHPIFGVDGIMHGVAKRGKGYVLNPNYPRRSFKVFGDNGFEVGTWFPMQIVALFNGAHGSARGGIAGSRALGAYSIITSGSYDDLDQDHGDVLYYSGSRSHENTDPTSPGFPSNATLAMRRSYETGQFVRVLRAASGKGRWSPTKGIRYDGLYRVVDISTPLNGKGGQYEQFKLVRKPGQIPLDDLVRCSPTPQQLNHYESIKDGYPIVG